MAEFIVMPKLGFDMQEAVLNNWLKEIGDPISRGEVVAEIESDKATLELESQADGILLHTLEAPGAIVPVGANLAIIGAEGEDFSDLLGANGDAVKAEEKTPASEPESAVPSKQTQTSQPAAIIPSSDEFPGGVKATPVARRVAQEKGIDLTQVSGSGPDGRIRKTDVETFVTQPVAEAPVATITPLVTDESEEIPLTKLRQAIGRRMTASKTTVPHFYVTSDIDMAEALALRKQVNAALPDEQKVTVNDLIVKAAALALRDFPNLNAAFAEDKIIRHKRIHVGTAVAVEGGLLTIVQKNTDTSTLSKVAADNKAMIERARNGRVKPDDVEGATFTVSNLGAFDVDHFIAIINPPDAAILAVGSAKKVPVIVDNEITIGTRMKATISADHRVSDGAEAAQFMQSIKALLENPLRLLL
ncbi:MAG: 2-oxo acid dehydrogenase subunit E2 [Anaerolineales bacterium]|nr:2-oxo acid dehydrogenase subunit E2 [Anaerolineales bacterium]